MKDPLFEQGTKIADSKEVYDKTINEIKRLMGGYLIDLELDPEDYNLSLDLALERYQTRSQNSVEENFIFVEVQQEMQTYTLPNEVMQVRKAHRRGVATGTSGGGMMLDPFSMALTNTLYMMPQGAGGLATYDLAAQHRETIGRLFGHELLFTWNPTGKQITFHRRFTGNEAVSLWCYMYRPASVLLTEVYSRQWIRRYAMAQCKMILGEARATYSQYPGPAGGTTLNGAEMKNEALAEMTLLEEELMRQKDTGPGYGFVIG